jgi:tetratricopeptide (TPR) repeat protein
MAVYNIGLTKLLTDSRTQALERFIEADRLKGDVFEPAFQAGRLYLDMQKHDRGVRYLEKAVRLRPESALAQRYLGDGYAALDMKDEAVKAYKQAIKLNPDDAAALSAVGCLFEARGENTEIATVFCEQSVAISPNNGLFRHRLGFLYLQQDRLEEALKEFEKAAELGYESNQFIEEIQNRLTARAS